KSTPIKCGESQQEGSITIELVACGASPNLRGTAAKVEAALSPEEGAADEFRLVLIEVLAVQIESEPDVVPPLGPVEVGHVLILRVAPVVGHVVVVGP